MPINSRPSNTRRNRAAGPAPVAAERRQRQRLRDLCDEVLASHRLARGEELFSERDQLEGRALLQSLTAAR